MQFLVEYLDFLFLSLSFVPMGLHLNFFSYVLTVFRRFTPSMSRRQLFRDMLEDQCSESNYICYDNHGDACTCSNYLDVDWLSSSGNSCEEEIYER